jgi:hypothetical protein
VFQQDILDATNSYRAEHNASPLVWNETLADGADGYVYGCKSTVYVRSLNELISVVDANTTALAQSVRRDQGSRIQQPRTHGRGLGGRRERV